MPYSNISLITDRNLLFQQYDFIKLSHDENNYIIGRVVSYDLNSGEMIFTPIQVNGSGTYDSWNIALTGSPGPSGQTGTSGTSGSSTEIYASVPHAIVKVLADGVHVGEARNLTFDGHTLSIDPFSYSTGGNPVYRIVYHNDGTAGTAGLVVRSTAVGQSYKGIIENRVPRNYQHQFVVGDFNISHIDAQGLHVQQALIADNGVYFQSLEQDQSQTRFLVWDPSANPDGLQGKVKWTTSGAAGAQGPSGSSGTSGLSGLSGSSGTSGLSGSSFMFLGGWSQNGGISDVPYGFNDIVVWPTSGPNMIVYVYTSDGTAPIGSPAPNLDPNWKVMVAGGSDGTSGTSGQVGTSGTSGENGTSGTSGENGTSGSSGENGTSGSSGFTGVNGSSGTSGISGSDGTSGTSFASPYSGNLNVTSGQVWVSADANGNTTSSTAVNWNDSNIQTFTLNAATTTFTFSNGQAGATYILIIRQNASGSQVITWPNTVSWAGASTPTMTATASRYDVFTFIFDGTKYFGSFIQNFT